MLSCVNSYSSLVSLSTKNVDEGNKFLCALWSDILLDYYLLENEYDDVFCPKKHVRIAAFTWLLELLNMLELLNFTWLLELLNMLELLNFTWLLELLNMLDMLELLNFTWLLELLNMLDMLLDFT
jgi:hypothetical protein